MKRFALGFSLLFRAIFVLLNTQKLRRIAMMPFLITAAACVGLLPLGLRFLFAAIPNWNSELQHQWLGHSERWLEVFLYFCLWPVMLLALGFAIYLVTALLAAPVYSYFAKECLRVIGFQNFGTDKTGFARWSINLLLDSFLKFIPYSIVGALSLGLIFIPGLGFLATLLFVTLMAFDFTDYSLEQLDINWRERIHIVFFSGTNRSLLIGFATAIAVFLIVPGAFLIVSPIGIVAGALLTQNLQFENRQIEAKVTK